VRFAQEVGELVVLGEPGAPGGRPAALGPCKQGVERGLCFVACVFVRHGLYHLAIGSLSFGEGGSICDGHTARVKSWLQVGNVLATLVNCLTRTSGPL